VNPDPETASDLDLAVALADAADELAMLRFQAPDLVVQRKGDASPVTDADRTIELLLRERLAAARPRDAVVGEEGGTSGQSARVWYLDPIDGTSRFITGSTEWYVLIALAVEGKPVVGVASAPALGERWWAARGHGAFRDGDRIGVSDCTSLAEATVTDDWDASLAHGTADERLAKLAGACRSVRPHEGYSHLVVAAGHADVALAVEGLAWDFAAAQVIVEEAGGRFTDADGRDAFDSGHSLVSNGRLHEQALSALGGPGLAAYTSGNLPGRR
jgi:histidinol-phosphatase